MRLGHRWVLIVAILALVLAGQQPVSCVAGAGLTGMLRGAGRCPLTSSQSFKCSFTGRFRGQVDGTTRIGTWALTFSAHETSVGWELRSQPAGSFRLVLPKTATKPRLVATSAAPPAGVIEVENDETHFHLSLDFALTGGLTFDVSVDGKFGPETAALRSPRLVAEMTMGPAGGASPTRRGLAPALHRPGDSAGQAGHGAVLFTGSGEGRGECFLTSARSHVCSWVGTFSGKLLGEPRSGRFRLRVYAEEALATGAAPPPYNPKELSVDKAVRWQFLATDTRPARTLVFGPTGGGTVVANDQQGLDFSLSLASARSGLVLKLGFICKWEGPELNATGNEVAIETMEIVHEGIS